MAKAVQTPDDEQHQADDAEYHERQENEANTLAKKHEERVERRMELPERFLEEQEKGHRDEKSRYECVHRYLAPHASPASLQ
ncbi:MAG: hypothetical protein M0Q94_10920 [Candidatus Cloacimonetes bacterium]|nr:hypothetical protein [Candidatus Cloacimonadota bacterium]